MVVYWGFLQEISGRFLVAVFRTAARPASARTSGGDRVSLASELRAWPKPLGTMRRSGPQIKASQGGYAYRAPTAGPPSTGRRSGRVADLMVLDYAGDVLSI
jgi:hypothetical protein